MNYTRSFVFLAALSLAVPGYAQEKLRTRGDLLVGGGTVMTGMCAQQQEAAKNATSAGMMRYTDQGVETWCSCAPKEFDRLVAELAEPIAQETALKTFNQATAICSGRQTRASTLEVCATDKDVKERAANVQAYCGCVKARLADLSDEQLHTDLNAAYQQEMRDAAKQSRELVFIENFALRKYGAGCESAVLSKLK